MMTVMNPILLLLLWLVFEGNAVPLAAESPSAGWDLQLTPTADTAMVEYSPLHYPLRVSVAAGFFPGNKQYPFGEPFEIFRDNWGSLRLKTEQGVASSQVPPAASLEVAYPFTPFLFAYVRASIKRDIRAWHRDPLGSNWPTQANEVDLNEPSLGYIVANSDWGRILFGRFPMHLGPSPEYSLLMGGQKPWHDGALITLKAPLVRYHFFFSSLNTWLEGSPQGDTSNTNYPIGSEAWRQTHYPQTLAENAHLRVYDARAKSVVVHRLELLLGRSREGNTRAWGLTLGLSEMQAIGGKVPDLLDLEPFTVWHNDFKYGYTNNLVHVDARLEAPFGLAFMGELAMDDLPYARKEGDKQHAILGHLLGIEQRGKLPGFSWVQRAHFIVTDPLLYHFIQPYNTLYARQVLSSNDQTGEGVGELFADRFVIDYPIGYYRGGDARDIWYHASVRLQPSPWFKRGLHSQLKLGYLEHGEVTLYTPRENVDDALSAPTGTPLEEWRAEATVTWPLPKGLSVRAGLGSGSWEQGAASGRHFWGEAGVLWAWGGE